MRPDLGSSISDLKSLTFMCHLEGVIGKVKIFAGNYREVIPPVDWTIDWLIDWLMVSSPHFGHLIDWLIDLLYCHNVLLRYPIHDEAWYFSLSLPVYSDSEPKLLLILSKSVIAQIGLDNEIYRIDQVGILALSPSEPEPGDRLLVRRESDSDIFPPLCGGPLLTKMINCVT